MHKLRFRELEETDLETLRQWRMLPEITKYLYSDPIITKKEQIQWYKDMKEKGDSLYWIVSFEGTDIGYATLESIDKKNKRAYPKVYIGELEYQGKGLGQQMITALERYAFDHLHLHKLCADIFSENYSSLISYLKCRWKIEGILKDHVFKDKFYDVYILEKKLSKMKIRIIAPLPPNRRHLHIQCGDYWVKKDLENEFINRGYDIVEENADLDFYLFGNYVYDKYIIAPIRFCWIYSHPDLINSYKWDEFSKQFDHIFVLSNKLKKDTSTASVLLGASSKEFIPRTEKTVYDIMFVGNSEKPARVELMKYLIEINKYKICLVGRGWPKKLGKQIKKVDYKGPYIANDKLGEFFNQGKLSFYASHEDMRKEGFVAVRILDIFRSSENLCILDDNLGLKDIFRSIPIYKNKTELVEQIDWLLQYSRKRRDIALKCREDVQQWTFGKIVTEIEKWIKKLSIQY